MFSVVVAIALWFTPNYGEYLLVFAGVTYYLAAVDDLEDLDRLLYKKTRVMKRSMMHKRQVDLENVPLLGVPCHRWY